MTNELNELVAALREAGYLVIHRDDLAAMAKESFKRILVEQYPELVEHIRNKSGPLSGLH